MNLFIEQNLRSRNVLKHPLRSSHDAGLTNAINCDRIAAKNNGAGSSRTKTYDNKHYATSTFIHNFHL